MPPLENRPLLGIASMVSGIALIVVAFGLIKMLGDRYPVVQIMFLRALFGLALVFMLAARAPGGWSALVPRTPMGHLARAFYGIVATVAMLLALRYLPLAEISALSSAAPLIMTALSVPLLGESVGWRRWAAVGVGFIGVLVILRPGAGVFQPAALLPLLDALCYALAMITVRKLTATDGILSIMFSFSIIMAGLTALAQPFIWVEPSVEDWGIILALGVVGALGQLLMVRAFALAPASLIAPFDYAGLLWMVLVGYLFFGEVPDVEIWVGSAIVVGSGLYILYRETMVSRRGPG